MTTQVKSAISTAAFTVLVILLMIFVSGYTFDEAENKREHQEDYNEKIPPAGFEVSLGDSPDVGKGTLPTPTTTNNTKTKPSTTTSQQKTPTQPNSDAKVVSGKEDVVSDSKSDQTKPEEPQQTVDPRALYTGRRNQTSNDGGQHGNTETPGYGGNPKGDANSTSPTSGTGKHGPSYSLNGRTAVSLPEPQYNSNIQGKIVVKIKVNRQGKVTFADGPEKGSTISDRRLVDQAKAAAYRSRFDASSSAPEEQSGTITYIFTIG